MDRYRSSYHIWPICSFWKDILTETSICHQTTLTVTFDLVSKYLNLGCIIFLLWLLFNTFIEDISTFVFGTLQHPFSHKTVRHRNHLQRTFKLGICLLCVNTFSTIPTFFYRVALTLNFDLFLHFVYKLPASWEPMEVRGPSWSNGFTHRHFRYIYLSFYHVYILSILHVIWINSGVLISQKQKTEDV